MYSITQRFYLAVFLSILFLTSFVHGAQGETIDGVYRGTVGKEQIVLEIQAYVEDSGTTTYGRYFYRRDGACVWLKGTRLKDGSIYLKKNDPSPEENEFWLTFRGGQVTGEFQETDLSSIRNSVKRSAVSLIRVSRALSPNDDQSPLRQTYNDLLLDFPLKTSREIQVDRQVAYVVKSDARFPARLPLLTRFPDQRVKGKINADLAHELNERRLSDSACARNLGSPELWDETDKVHFVGHDILSLVRETRDYCHSDESGVDILLYNLHTGEPLDMNDLFQAQSTAVEPKGDGFIPTDQQFLPFADLYLKHMLRSQGECREHISQKAFLAGSFALSAYFLKEGLVLSPLVGHSARQCADDEIVPYSELRGLIKKKGPFKTVRALTQTKSRVSSLVYVARSLQLVHEGEFSGQDVIPPRVRHLQSRFKHELQHFIGEVINQSAENSTLQQIRRTILKNLRGMGIFEGFKEYGPDYTYGHVLDVRLDQVLQHPDLLAIGLIIDVNWDEDESLYIFQHQSNGWFNVLAAEVNGYPEVWDAQSSRFNYAVSPSAPDGTWFLVTSSVNPHKASAWQHVTYTALAPGPDADHPRRLMRHTHVIYLAGSDDESHACHIRASESGFRVRFNIGSDDPPEEKYFSDEYRIVHGVAKRIAVRCRTRNIMGRRVSCDPEDKM